MLEFARHDSFDQIRSLVSRGKWVDASRDRCGRAIRASAAAASQLAKVTEICPTSPPIRTIVRARARAASLLGDDCQYALHSTFYFHLMT